MSKAVGLLELNKVENDRMARKINDAHEIQSLKETFKEGSLSEQHRAAIEELLATNPIKESKQILKLMLGHLNTIQESDQGGLTQNEKDIVDGVSKAFTDAIKQSRSNLDDEVWEGTRSHSTKPSDHEVKGTRGAKKRPSIIQLGSKAKAKKGPSATKRIGTNLKLAVTKKIKK
jgi:hypothetical protein